MNISNHNWVAIVGAALVFIAASALPCFGDILFEDDFNDNTIDYSKWSELYTDGIWQEINQRVEFEVQEPGSGKNREGIVSIGLPAELSTTQGIVFSWDQITNIGSTGSVGQVNVNITDGTNYIQIRYIRGDNTVRIRDSNDASEWTFITHGDGTWSNEIRIYSDRYSITIDEDETGWISDAIFPSNPTLSVKIYIENGGSSPWYMQRSGFDNVQVETISEQPEPFYFVHITDPHVERDDGTDTYWKSAIETILGWPTAPKFVVCTGDLVEYGFHYNISPGFYNTLKSVLHPSEGVFYIDSAHSIPIYFCPGNHDARNRLEVTGPYSFEIYHSYIGPDYFHTIHAGCAIFSLNSGADIWPCANFPNCPGGFLRWQYPEGDGIKDDYDDELSRFVSDLDNLDGVIDNSDSSPFYKIVLTHHPYRTYISSSDKDGVFWNGRQEFNQAFDDFDVDILLSGHIHSPSEYMLYGAKCVVTDALAEGGYYRKIWVQNGEIEVGPQEEFFHTIGASIACKAIIHVYDNYENHNGPDDFGDIEIEIPHSYYSHFLFQDDTLGIDYTSSVMSMMETDSTDYTCTIESLSDQPVNIVLFTCSNGEKIEVNYDSIAVDSGTIVEILAPQSVFNDTLFVDDDGDGIADRWILPSFLCGDADDNTIVEITDAVYLINYIFVPGSPAPDPLAAGDVDCNTIVEITDAVYLINYVFVPGSPAPCDPDGDGTPDC